MHVLGKVNLTSEQLSLLPSICWHEELEEAKLEGLRELEKRSGIPAGVQCAKTQWCDDMGLCTEVCARGSVEVVPWLRNAIKTQAQLSRRLPLCLATLLGTHNSGITIADGYGNRDEYFQQYFKWIRWVSSSSKLRTNDQFLSLTDQLNLGVRAVELDTHWVEGELRIAHCGGFHAAPFNVLVKAVNLVATLLGHPIHWDTETVGCDPSLSSIPVAAQRSFADALAELAAWLVQPGNEEEFLLVFLDDQPDIQAWGFLPKLLIEVRQAFPGSMLYTPKDHAARNASDWPSMAELVAAGRRVMVVSGADYGPDAADILFTRPDVCGWQEPPLGDFKGQPSCIADQQAGFAGDPHTLEGTLFRVTSCEILYGPLNCGFVPSGENWPVLDEKNLHEVTACGLNMPCPDLLTPQRAAGAIWTWAPGQPYDADWSRDWQAGWMQYLLRLWRPLHKRLELQDVELCAIMRAEDGRWRARPCTELYPNACRSQQGGWALVEGESRGTCPEGTAFAVPRHAKENAALQRALQRASQEACWLPLQGPDWDSTEEPTALPGV
ncbi:hypothetical protein CVIRNUC_000356 [Coccomyxa viridis]|uniref:Uncharacterized protein n=1 Tax=Coccomyxa viridis TaxID=1274662 RepID=A0AAV1HST6_9CHLO|nr:hypothetical protein CVIRNUC_000356 [Coccomyxa viridis]